MAPGTVRDLAVDRLRALRDAGAVAPMRVGEECSRALGRLRYAG